MEICNVSKESQPFMQLSKINISQSLSSISPRTDLKMKPVFLEHCFFKMCKSKTS